MEKHKKQYHHGDLKQSLLNAAEMELSEKGVEAFSLRGVAKRSGVSHAAPAHHFKDAQGLLTALASSGFERFVALQQKRQKQANTPLAQLVASGMGYIEFAIEYPAMFRLMFTSDRLDPDDQALATTGKTAYDHLANAIEQLVGDDPYQNCEAQQTLITAWGLVHGMADLIISQRLKMIYAMDKAERDKLIEGLLTDVFEKHTQDKRD